MTASSMMAARSPSGTEPRLSAWSRSSFSRSSALAVNWTLYRPSARGSIRRGPGRRRQRRDGLQAGGRDSVRTESRGGRYDAVEADSARGHCFWTQFEVCRRDSCPTELASAAEAPSAGAQAGRRGRFRRAQDADLHWGASVSPPGHPAGGRAPRSAPRSAAWTCRRPPAEASPDSPGSGAAPAWRCRSGASARRPASPGAPDAPERRGRRRCAGRPRPPRDGAPPYSTQTWKVKLRGRTAAANRPRRRERRGPTRRDGTAPGARRDAAAARRPGSTSASEWVAYQQYRQAFLEPRARRRPRETNRAGVRRFRRRIARSRGPNAGTTRGLSGTSASSGRWALEICQVPLRIFLAARPASGPLLLRRLSPSGPSRRHPSTESHASAGTPGRSERGAGERGRISRRRHALGFGCRWKWP